MAGEGAGAGPGLVTMEGHGAEGQQERPMAMGDAERWVPPLPKKSHGERRVPPP